MLGKMFLPSLVLIPVGVGNVWGFVMPANVNSYFCDYLSMTVSDIDVYGIIVLIIKKI